MRKVITLARKDEGKGDRQKEVDGREKLNHCTCTSATGFEGAGLCSTTCEQEHAETVFKSTNAV